MDEKLKILEVLLPECPVIFPIIFITFPNFPFVGVNIRPLVLATDWDTFPEMLMLIPCSLIRIRGAVEPNSKVDEVMFIIWEFIEHVIVPPAVTVGFAVLVLFVSKPASREVVSISTVIAKLFKYMSSLTVGKEVAGTQVIASTDEVTHELVVLQNNPLAEGLNSAIS